MKQKINCLMAEFFIGENLGIIVASRIRRFSNLIKDFQGSKENFRKLLKMLVTDRSMQPVFKRMIRQELSKSSNQKERVADEQVVMNIRQSLKRRLIALVKNECFKLQKQQSYRQRQKDIITQDKVQQSRKVRQIIEIDDDDDDSEEYVHHIKQLKGQKIIKPLITDLIPSAASKRHSIFPTQNLGKKTEQPALISDKGINQLKQPTRHLPPPGKEHKSQKGYQKQSSKCLDQLVRRTLIRKYVSFAPKAKLSLSSAFEKTEKLGHFQYGDKISRIIDFQMGCNAENSNLLIQWQPRKDGSVPASSMLSLSQFSYFQPLEAKIFTEQANLND